MKSELPALLGIAALAEVESQKEHEFEIKKKPKRKGSTLQERKLAKRRVKNRMQKASRKANRK